MKACLINYNHRPEWLLKSDLDYLIYDRSDDESYLQDFPKERIVKTRNIGNVDYDKLSFLVDFYDQLPDVFLWGKTNLFKYISEEEFDLVKNNKTFTPLLTKNHKTYSDNQGTVCFYDEIGMYNERNDSWYLNEHYGRYVKSWKDWADTFQLPSPRYIPFAPGGNYILTREAVHKYSRDLYQNMKSLMDYSQLPGEAQCAERSYFLLWK